MKSIHELVEIYSTGRETPKVYWKWAVYAMISAVLRDNVYCSFFGGTMIVHPNMFIILEGDSGIRKDAPVKLAQDVIQYVNNTKIMTGRCTVQALGLFLSDEGNDTQRQVRGASGIMIHGELISLLHAGSDDTIAILTDYWDYMDKMEIRTVGGGVKTLHNRCLSLFSASNTAFFKELYRGVAVQGGLLGRTLLVYADKSEPRNAGVDDDGMGEERKRAKEEIKQIVKRIANGVKGEMIFNHEAKQIYKKWYEQDLDLKGDKHGVYKRVHVQACKIAMCIALSNRYEQILADKNCMFITGEEISEGIRETTRLLKNFDRFTMGGVGSMSPTANPLQIILAYLYAQEEPVPRQQLLRDNFTHFTGKELDEQLIPTLDQAGLISMQMTGGNVYYELTDATRRKMSAT